MAGAPLSRRDYYYEFFFVYTLSIAFLASTLHTQLTPLLYALAAATPLLPLLIPGKLKPVATANLLAAAILALASTHAQPPPPTATALYTAAAALLLAPLLTGKRLEATYYGVAMLALLLAIDTDPYDHTPLLLAAAAAYTGALLYTGKQDPMLRAIPAYLAALTTLHLLNTTANILQAAAALYASLTPIGIALLSHLWNTPERAATRLAYATTIAAYLYTYLTTTTQLREQILTASSLILVTIFLAAPHPPHSGEASEPQTPSQHHNHIAKNIKPRTSKHTNDPR